MGVTGVNYVAFWLLSPFLSQEKEDKKHASIGLPFCVCCLSRGLAKKQGLAGGGIAKSENVHHVKCEYDNNRGCFMDGHPSDVKYFMNARGL